MENIYTEGCSVSVGILEDMSIVEIAGEFDLATVPLLAKALGDAESSSKGNVILDAQQLTYIDSSGLQTLISAQNNLRRMSRRMVIVGCHGIFRKLLSLSKTDTLFTMFASIEDAVESLAGHSAECPGNH